MIRKPYSFFMILLLALLLAAPAMAAPPDPIGGLAIASVLNVPAPVVFDVQKTENRNVQEITFYKNFTVDSYTTVETAAVLSVRTEFSCECCGATVIDRPNGDGLYRGQGGGELFSSGFIV